jgi:hypothetical protein
MKDLTFREYIEDMLRPIETNPCDCSLPDACPYGHHWLEGGQGFGVKEATEYAIGNAGRFIDAPNSKRGIKNLVNQMAKEILNELRTE